MVRETAILDDLPVNVPAPALPADDLRLLHHFLHDNDAQAFGEIVRRYAGMVYATCLRIVGDSARAEDVSQDTFFRLISRGHEVHTSLPAWLHRTATHLAIDAIRSDEARKQREIDYCQTSDHAASTWAELSPAVDQALCDLPDDLRQVLVQHFLLGRTQAEIAEQLNLSPPTVSRRVREALEQLRIRLRLKGVVALSMALAGLLCHVAARQAPASLVRQLGKMAMFQSAASLPPTASGAAAGGQISFVGATVARITASKITAILLLVAGIFAIIVTFQHLAGRVHLPVITPPAQQEVQP